MRRLAFVLFALSFVVGCNTAKAPEQQAAAPVPQAETSEPRIYVTNEVSGDLSIIDSGNYNVLATVPLGKRPRGIHPSPDHQTIYVALSGSPIAGPGPARTVAVACRKCADVINDSADSGNFATTRQGKTHRPTPGINFYW